MKEQSIIFLPGGFKQFRILKSKFNFSEKNVLIVGEGSEKIAEKIVQAGAKHVDLIVNDFDFLMIGKINLKTHDRIEIKLMDFDNTDYAENQFDLIYAQGSISFPNRNKIVKEMKRILKRDGILCTGEITALTKTYPIFVKNIFESSDMSPLFHSGVEQYYEERGFEIIYLQDITSSLKNFYENAASAFRSNVDNLSQQEKSYYKKLLNKLSHESNAYLNLGADKYVGMKVLILKKVS